MTKNPLRILFLGTGNSARSILAEAVMNTHGKGRFIGYSAAPQPTGALNQFAISLLAREGIDTGFARSKSWDEFAGPGAPNLDFVFTVCDRLAANICPDWQGQPVSLHWALPDPAAVDGTDAQKAVAFAQTYRALTRRISAFVELPLSALDAITLQARLREIV